MSMDDHMKLALVLQQLDAHTEIAVPDRRALRRKRVGWAIAFVLIWIAFLGPLMMSNLVPDFVQDIGGVLLIGLLLGVHFLPALNAYSRGHHNRGAIFVLNLLLGWTVLGWIVALVWSCTTIKS